MGGTGGGGGGGGGTENAMPSLFFKTHTKQKNDKMTEDTGMLRKYPASDQHVSQPIATF